MIRERLQVMARGARGASLKQTLERMRRAHERLERAARNMEQRIRAARRRRG